LIIFLIIFESKLITNAYKIDLAIADLNAEGTTPEVREEFMAWVIGQTQSMKKKKRHGNWISWRRTTFAGVY